MGVYTTDKIISAISPRDHHSFRGETPDKVKTHSQQIMSELCDKDYEFYVQKGQDKQSHAGHGFKMDKQGNYNKLSKHDAVRL